MKARFRFPALPFLGLCLLLTAAARGQVETDELKKLREGFEAARFKVLDPLEKKYVGELEKLKERFTKEGKLAEALGVEAELKRFLNGAAAAGFKGQLVPEILCKGEWKFFIKRQNFTAWISFTATGDIFERGKEAPIGRWDLSSKPGVLRLDFKRTWNEFTTEWEGAKPVLKEKDSDEGKRIGVTLEQA